MFYERERERERERVRERNFCKAFQLKAVYFVPFRRKDKSQTKLFLAENSDRCGVYSLPFLKKMNFASSISH
ncbi:hypothetical protein PGB90_002997 [Kerria lacca]